MSQPVSQFRNAAFGGFNRQDVLDYLEKNARESGERLQRAEAERDELAARVQKLEADNRDLRQSHDTLTQERDLLLRDADELAALRTEVQELRARTAQLQPEVDAFRELKRQLADIEVEARLRGEAIVQKADNEAAAVRTGAERLLAQTRRTFETTRTDVETTISHLSGELERLCGVLNRLGTPLDENAAAVAALKLPEGEG